MAEVTVERHDGPEAARTLGVLLPAYREIYVEPPYCEGPQDVVDFTEMFAIQSERPGFRVALAQHTGEVVGFAYGFCLPPDTGWWRNLLTAAPAGFTAEDGRRTFAVIELAVRRRRRRQGIARRLHATLLEGLEVERVTLTVRPEPEAAPAQAAYAAWRYRKIGQSQPGDDAPVYDAMVLQLR
ncbi:GNAT family N-acetyltransferase [Streptomyces sp. WMMC500]|uniref:GNAT family N-acetyltransferase n=1 Tax=Streptomyces sp. WMMC500 TaxID=3015154 RepID=UPI00248AAF4F|nr:GNAT family N-acetyltransferase [Streptomyces sp. WMMC500]WBB59294.1 GNAT family N-acetyltransferase [Streptomyces sp. WMMC500]